MTALDTTSRRQQWERDGFFILRELFTPERVGGLVDAAIAMARRAADDPTTIVVPEGNVWPGATEPSFYFPYDPDHQVGVWTAVSRATLANGCLHVVPGTHLEPVHTHVPDARPNVTTSYFEIVDHDSSAEVAVEMEPGDVLFFDSHVMHASTDNATDELRAAYVCHYTAMGTKLPMEYALYHDQALCKEPGGGPTPWHQDQHYWLIVSPDTVTMWLALDDVPPEIGTMTFVPGTHRFANLVDLGISDESRPPRRP